MTIPADVKIKAYRGGAGGLFTIVYMDDYLPIRL